MTVLADRPRDAFTIAQIAYLTGLKKGHVRVVLHRLYGENRVARVARGLYQHPKGLVYPSAPDSRLRIHGLKVECRCNVSMRWPFRRALSVVTERFPSPWLHRHPKNHSITTKGEWNDRPLSITVHPDDTVLLEVWMKASFLPLHLIEAHAYLGGFLPGAFGIPPEHWTITQADWNIDVPGNIDTELKLKAVSVSTFLKLMLKIYQKEDLVRTEVRSFQPLDAKPFVGYIESILTALQQANGDRP